MNYEIDYLGPENNFDTYIIMKFKRKYIFIELDL